MKEVLPVIISVASSTLISVVGLLSNHLLKRKESELYRQQVSQLFEPLIIELLEPLPCQIKMAAILKSNYSIVPIEIMEYRDALKNDYADLKQFEKVMLNHYNIIRKRMGYPFDERRIVPQSRPIESKAIYRRRWTSVLLLCFMIISSSIAIMASVPEGGSVGFTFLSWGPPVLLLIIGYMLFVSQ